MQNQRINKYSILDKLGDGAFGSVYKGQHVFTKECVAIKVEPREKNTNILKHEALIYLYLKNCANIPKMRWFGSDLENNYMVVDLLGESLVQYKERVGYLSTDRIKDLGTQMIVALQHIHEYKLIHRDVKPDNFLFTKLGDLNQDTTEEDKLYLVDFGFACIFPTKEASRLIGSKNYSSINAHMLHPLAPKDDLESVGYIMLYLFLGSLPWSNDVDETIIIEKKKQIIYNKGLLPDFITKYFSNLTNLK